MSKHWSTLGLICILAALAAGSALGAPTHLGPTGIVATPTADVVPVGWYDLAVDYHQLDVADETIQHWPGRAVVGIADRAELGIAYSLVSNQTDGRLLGLNGKFQLSREDSKRPAIAVGASFHRISSGLEEEVGFGDVTTLYAVMSKTVSGHYADETGTDATVQAFGGPSVRASLGLMYNSYGDGATIKRTKPFLGVEFNWGAGSALALEYKAAEKGVLQDEAISSVVFRHQFTPTLVAQLGVTNALGTFASDKHGFFLGVTYHWGVTEEEGTYF